MKLNQFWQTLVNILIALACVISVMLLCNCKTTKDIQVSQDSVKVSYLDKIEIKDFWENLTNKIYTSLDSFGIDIEYPKDSTKPKVHIQGKGLKSSKENQLIKSTEETQQVTRKDSNNTQRKENNKIKKEPKYMDPDFRFLYVGIIITVIFVILIWFWIKIKN